ncbi:TPM domain-containing protein [Candidatus Saccharibacteria bacterium]|nr:TPM domain-containing protein [Candidatus Saccharibacteria bacterium]
MLLGRKGAVVPAFVIAVLAWLGLQLAFAPGAAALAVPPKPTDVPIVDQTGTLTPEQIKSLAATIAGERQHSGNQIGVLMVRSLEGEDAFDYSLKVARQWGIGSKQSNNGVLFFIAKDDRRMQIQVGYGLEGALTDARAGRIIRDRIRPEFREGRYYEGIQSGLTGITTAIHNEVDPNLKSDPVQEESGGGFPLELFFVALFFIPSWLGSILARSKSWWAGGVIGGVSGVVLGLLFGFLFTGILSIIGLTILGLLFDKAVSSNYQRRVSHGDSPSWWAGGTTFGGGMGGGGSGGGGFGGFGGGGFGGGGAGGDW